MKGAAWEIPIPFIVLGGIYGGFFTATEAAAVTAFYVFVIEVFVYRDISIRSDLKRVIRESMMLVGGILVILSAALGLANFMVDAEIPMKLFELVKDVITSKYSFLIILNLFLLIVGALMDIFSAIMVVVPIILPVAENFGIHPVHLGIIFLTNLGIGYSTPPIGMNLFIASFRFEKSIWSLAVSTMNERGKRDAHAAGLKLLNRQLIPDLFLVSPSRRTRSTAKRILQELNCSKDMMRIDDRIYQNRLNILISVLKGIGDQFESVLLIGHNPSVTELSQYLSMNALDEMPTSAIAAFDLDISSWSEIGKATSSLIFYDFPKQEDGSADEAK